MIDGDKPLKVAVLGCGSVGSQVVRLLGEQADDLAARIGAPLELVGRRRTPHRRAARGRRAARAPHHRRPRPRDPSRRRHRHRGHRRHRAGPVADPRARWRTAPRWSPPTRRCWPRTARRSTPPPPAPAGERGATSTSRPPSPGPSRSSGRCASRWPATASPACWASSTAPPTSSSTRWTPPAPASRRPSRRPRTLGYAEADPTADVEGFDAAAKAAILASLAFHTRVTAADVHREGISEVTAADVASARDMGSVVKLLAIAELKDDAVAVRVHPGDDPAQPPAGLGARGLQRRLRRVRGGRPADVLRPRRRRLARPRRPSSATSSPSPATGSPAPAARASRRTPTAACCRWGRP